MKIVHHRPQDQQLVVLLFHGQTLKQLNHHIWMLGKFNPHFKFKVEISLPSLCMLKLEYRHLSILAKEKRFENWHSLGGCYKHCIGFRSIINLRAAYLWSFLGISMKPSSLDFLYFFVAMWVLSLEFFLC